MKKMGSKGQSWLKAFHGLFGCMWVGAAICLCSKQFFISASDGGELYGVTSTLKFIDDFIIIPGAMGVLVTGIIYSVWTNWGWFKHSWVTVKWIICLFGIIFGTYPLGHWLDSLPAISKLKGLDALADPAFLHNSKMLSVFGTFQGLSLIFALLISAIKPWRKKKAE